MTVDKDVRLSDLDIVSAAGPCSSVVQGACKVSADADAPTTMLLMVPRPSRGGLWDVQSYYAVLQAGRRACVPYGFGMKQSTIFSGIRDGARCAKADGLPDSSRRGRCAQICERRDL